MKPQISSYPTAEEIQTLENKGTVFDTHGGKRIVGHAKNSGYQICFLEDQTEIIRAPDGTFLNEWPANVQEGA